MAGGGRASRRCLWPGRGRDGGWDSRFRDNVKRSGLLMYHGSGLSAGCLYRNSFVFIISVLFLDVFYSYWPSLHKIKHISRGGVYRVPYGTRYTNSTLIESLMIIFLFCIIVLVISYYSPLETRATGSLTNAVPRAHTQRKRKRRPSRY